MTGAHARWSTLGCLLILLLAFGLRLGAIDRQDIWGDEAFSIWLSGQPLTQVLAGGADTHPPLYPFLLHLWMRVTGLAPLAVRSLSALVGTLTIPVVYVVGQQAFGRATGMFSSLLAAISPVLVFYSQETRMYGLVTLLAAASIYWTMRLLQTPDKRSAVCLAYVLATVGSTYTHYYAFFVILAQNVVVIPVLLRRRDRAGLRCWLAAQGVIILAYIPWIRAQSSFLSGKASTRFGELNLEGVWRIARETLTSFGAGLAVPTPTAWVVTALFLAAIVAGLPAVLRRRRPEAWLMLAYLSVPLFLAWAVNPIMPFFYARYLLLIAPAFFVLAAWGIVATRGLSRPLSAAGAVLLVLASLVGLYGYYTDEDYVKGRYGQMMAHVQSNAVDGDGLLLANQLQRPIYEYYQPDELAAYYFPSYDYPLEDPSTARDLEAISSRHPRLWLVRFGNPAEYDPSGFLDRWLSSHGSKAYFGGWTDADLALYVMMPASSADSSVQVPSEIDLGDRVRLLGYSLSTEEIAPGGTLLLSLQWQALQPIEERYTVFAHILDHQDKVVAQMDSEPQGGGLPTDRWLPGQVIQDNYALVVPTDVAAGQHAIEVGMYQLQSLERLPVLDAKAGKHLGDRILLGAVEIVDP